MASELPDLIEALHPSLGEVVDIKINWSTTAGAPIMHTHSQSVLARMRWNDSRQRIMVVVGRNGCARLLIVPNMTTASLGLMVLRRAAEMEIPTAEHESPEYLAADRLVRAAKEQSAADTATT